MRERERRIIRSPAGQAKACQHTLLVTEYLRGFHLESGVWGVNEAWAWVVEGGVVVAVGPSRDETKTKNRLRISIQSADSIGTSATWGIQFCPVPLSFCGDWQSCEVHQLPGQGYCATLSHQRNIQCRIQNTVAWYDLARFPGTLT